MLHRKATEILNNASPKNCGGQRTNKDRMRHTLHARITGETSNWEWWSYYGQSSQFKKGWLVGLCSSCLQLSRKDQSITNDTLSYLGYWAIHPVSGPKAIFSCHTQILLWGPDHAGSCILVKRGWWGGWCVLDLFLLAFSCSCLPPCPSLWRPSSSQSERPWPWVCCWENSIQCLLEQYYPPRIYPVKQMC